MKSNPQIVNEVLKLLSSYQLTCTHSKNILELTKSEIDMQMKLLKVTSYPKNCESDSELPFDL